MQIPGACACILAVAFVGLPVRADELDHLPIGLQRDGRIVVPTNQILKPAGTQAIFPGRPVDLALLEAGKTLVVKNMKGLVFLDTATGKITQTLTSSNAFSVVGLLVFGETVYVSDAQNLLHVALRNKDGSFAWSNSIELTRPKVGGAANPAGIALLSENELWVTSTRGNNLQLIDPQTKKVKQVIGVGIAPYMVCCPQPNRCYVSNWGGDPPGEKNLHSNSAGSPVRVDSHGIASSGSISVLAAMGGVWRQIKSIRTGLHPCGMVASPNGKILYVANANSDTVSVIDLATETVVETISCRPEGRFPFGSGTNALALGPDGKVLYAANGTNNCVAVIHLGVRATETPAPDASMASRVAGLIPTGWYPGAVMVSADGRRLFVANVKGHGSLSQPRAVEKGKNSHDYLGSVSLIEAPDPIRLAAYTAEVKANNRLGYSMAGLEKPRPGARPVPVPEQHGEPSVFRHVVYIIKENRTYDQVFGDMKEGNGDSRLCLFGEQVTPNHHALARQFTLFDNFYCSGVLSADGHQWVNEAYVTDYLEKSFGQFARSYPKDGDDPLAFASSGFLWDNALGRSKTLRNYGEFVRATYGKAITWKEIYDHYRDGTETVKIDVRANLKSLEPYTHAGYPGFVLGTPDVYRARIFLNELKEFEKKTEFPNLVYIYLPCDHTSGTRPGLPTPRASVADNDLALGQIVEAVSRSKFWPETCIFVVEDDPQNGFDHVDGHRTVALAVSPYTRRQFVDHTSYNQTGMVKTIELILGLPPMNQLDLSATAMRHCFQAEPDFSPYICSPNKVALDELNPSTKKLKGAALDWAKKSLALDFTDADRADEDTLNRILWHSVRGSDTPYPERSVGRQKDEVEDQERSPEKR